QSLRADHARVAALFAARRLVIGETVEQRGLQPLLGGELGHRGGQPSSQSNSIERSSSSGCSPPSVASIRWPCPIQVSSPSCDQSLARPRRNATSAWASLCG